MADQPTSPGLLRRFSAIFMILTNVIDAYPDVELTPEESGGLA